MISKKICEDRKLEIFPIEKLIDFDAANGTDIEYDGFVEANLQIPGKSFKDDILLLVVPTIPYHDKVPVILGTLTLDLVDDSFISNGEVELLEKPWQSVHQSITYRREGQEVHKGRSVEPLGFVKTTKSVVIPAHQTISVHGMTRAKNYGFTVNIIAEPTLKGSLPKGAVAKNTYCNLLPGSSRVTVLIQNQTSKKLVIPTKTIVCQIDMANQIPRLLAPDDDEDDEEENTSENDEHTDDESDEYVDDITYEKYVVNSNVNTEDRHDVGCPKHADGKHVNDPPEPEINTTKPDDGKWVLEKLDLTGLDEYSSDFQGKANALLCKNAFLFSKHDLDMGRTSLVKHNIILTDPVPFKEAYRRIPPQLYQEVKDHLQEMMDLGAIRKSCSPWSSPVVLVRKKDGRLRFCIDMRKLNSKTLKDSYYLPRIEQTLDHLLGSKIFTSLDLKCGYWQVEMVEECKPYTAFTCGPLGFYECDTMPFGATNAPATFQRLMENCLGELNLNWCIVYIDDIIIFSDTPEEHLKRLEAVFAKLAAAGLKLKPSKCEFFKKEITYLGHLISKDGVATDPKKIDAITKWPVPKTVNEVRTFLGFAGYYRRYIKGFSRIARPITNLTRGLESTSSRMAKKTMVDWGEDEQEAFQKLKDCFLTAPILAFPDHNLPFILHTDSSEEGLGAVLYQEQGGTKRVIAYASRSVSKTEAKYPPHKLEFLALKWAVTEKFHEYLYGGTFLMYTLTTTP